MYILKFAKFTPHNDSNPCGYVSLFAVDHGRRQDAFQRGAPDDSKGVHKDFPKRGFTYFLCI